MNNTEANKLTSPWQPIESAPKDGPNIQGWADEWIPEMAWSANAWCSWDSMEEYWAPISKQPTHWQPQPQPPAGVVTISNDSSLPKAGNNAETKEGIVPSPSDGLNAIARQKVLLPRDDREQVGQATPDVRPVPAVTPSPSPANIPPEGRGECVHGIKMTQVCEKCSRFLHFHNRGRGELLPFNLSDALAGKPVVTRDGREAYSFTYSGGDLVEGILDGILCSWFETGCRYSDGKSSRFDLFMLPTEGSGA